MRISFPSTESLIYVSHHIPLVASGGLLKFNSPILSPPELIRSMGNRIREGMPLTLKFHQGGDRPHTTDSRDEALLIPFKDSTSPMTPLSPHSTVQKDDMLFALFRHHVALVANGTILVTMGHWDSSLRLTNIDDCRELYRFSSHE